MAGSPLASGMAGQLGWTPMPEGPAALVSLVDGTDRLLAAWWRELDWAALEELLAVWKRVLEHEEFTTADPRFRAACLDRAAMASCWHAGEVKDLEELDGARRLLDRALAESDGTLEADIRYHAGIVQYNRAILTGDRDEARAAVATLRALLSELPAGETRLRPRCMDVLARSLQWLHARGEPDGNIEEAIALYRTALTTFPQQSPYRGTLAVMLASVLRERYKTSGRLSDLSEALELLDGVPSEGGFRTTFSYGNSLYGMLLRERYLRTGDVNDLHASLRFHEQAVATSAERSNTQLLALNNQANALQAAYHLENDLALLNQALDVLYAVVEATDPADTYYPARLNNLGNSLSSAYVETGDRSYLDQSIDLYAHAVEITASNDFELSSRHLNLARQLVIRYEDFRRRHDRREAVSQFRSACVTGMKRSPEWALEAAFSWGAWASSRQAWKEAVEAYTFGVQVIETLFARQSNRTDKETWLRTAQGIPARAAHAFIKAGRFEEAVLVQERSRALLLAEEFRHRTGDVPELDLNAVYAAAGDRVLVYLGSTEQGGFALLVDPVARKVRAVGLPTVTNDAVGSRVELMSGAYRAKDEDPRLWLGTVDAVTRWAYEEIFVSVLRRLPRGADHCVLVPTGQLALLPLHAAWRPDPGLGRRHLLDDVAVSYTPTAQTLRPAEGPEVFSHALVVDDPQPVSAPPLPWSSVECSAAARAAGRATVLAGPDATRSGVLAALGSHGLVHLSCHGVGRPDAPLDSALLMARDEPLTLRHLVELDRTVGARLVVMSACETFQIGTDLPEEVVSLPTGLLQLGCRGIVAGQWVVSSLTAVLLLAAFYRRCADGIAPDRALCEVQRTLRGLTNAELAELLRPVRAQETFGLLPGEARPLWRAVRRHDPKALPFAHATEWAAFTYIGG